jgi:integron integrase
MFVQSPDSARAPASAQPPRLLDQLRQATLAHFGRREPGQRYVDTVRRFIVFHGMRHPNTMGSPEIELFLTHLAVNEHVAASTQNQVLAALLFLYNDVLGLELPRLDAVRARRPKRLPNVLAPEEVRCLLDAVEGGNGAFRLMAGLCYGGGLRREECCRLRVHDLDMARNQIMVRHGKGGKDRIVMLPQVLRPDLERQLAWRRQLHERDLAAGLARVALPHALARKYPRAAQELGWQFVFASRQRSRDPKTGDIGRHHVHDGALGRAVAQAGRRAGLVRRVGCHTLRHTKAMHLLQSGISLDMIRDFLGHVDVKTTQGRKKGTSGRKKGRKKGTS